MEQLEKVRKWNRLSKWSNRRTLRGMILTGITVHLACSPGHIILPDYSEESHAMTVHIFLFTMAVQIFIHICHDSTYLLSTYHGRIDLYICNGSTDLHTCHDSTYILIYHCSICICACSPSPYFQHCHFSRLYRLHPHACCVKIIMTANASIVS